MESIKVSQRVGKDGTLRINIPVGEPNQEIEAIVIYQLAYSGRASQPSLESLYGILCRRYYYAQQSRELGCAR